MVEQHIETGAGVTVAGIRVPRAEASRVRRDRRRRATARCKRFLEKPADPPGLPDSPDETLRLDGQLRLHHRGAGRGAARRTPSDEGSVHDMGGSIMPMMVEAGRRPGLRLRRQRRARRDRARPRLLARRRDPRRLLRRAHGPGRGPPGLQPLQPAVADLHQPRRSCRRRSSSRAASRRSRSSAPGSIVSGATVRHSRDLARASRSCSRRVRRGLGAHGRRPDRAAARSCAAPSWTRTCVVPDGAHIGVDPDLDRQRYHVSDGGVVVLGKGAARAAVTDRRSSGLRCGEPAAADRHDVVTPRCGCAGAWPRVRRIRSPRRLLVKLRRVYVARRGGRGPGRPPAVPTTRATPARGGQPSASGTRRVQPGLGPEGRRAGRPGRQQDHVRRQAGRSAPTRRTRRTSSRTATARSSASTSTWSTRSPRSSA